MHSRRKGEHLPRRRELTWLRSRLASWLALAGILLGLAMLRTVVNGYLSAILVSMPTLALVAAHRGDARERAELERRANHDPLTGLPNRTLFTERLDRALADRVDDELALLFLDLDDFKTVNDSLGHLVGDRLLGLVATRLRDCTGELGLAARHSGDEFAILLPGCGEVQAAELAQQVLDALARPVMLREGEVLVRGSIGIAISDATVRNGSEMLARADMAMYRAKADGKNRYELYEPAHRAAVLARHQLRVELQQAVDTGVLSVEYQPIVSLRDQAVIGAEALVRWRHPRRGTIDPEEFITVAEQSGLIVPLGLQVIEESCRRLAAWDRQMPGLQLAVNVAGRQLKQPTFVTSVGVALATAGVDPTRLILEVKERVLIDDDPAIRQTLHGLRRLGVRIAVDDFGTGPCSLSSLREMPIDLLKIAKPFVDGLGRGDEQRAFVQAIVQLGDSLGLGMIAEGVERPEQAAALTELGCPTGQGFLFSRSLQAGDFIELFGRQILPLNVVDLAV